MNRKALTLNAGSSSLKIGLFERGRETPLVTGHAERLGGDARLILKSPDGKLLAERSGLDMRAENHDRALADLLEMLREIHADLDIAVVGHRVVHGGVTYAAPVVLDEHVLDRLSELEPFAPLHQPHNLDGIRSARSIFPEAVQIACFDTAFHRSHPFVNDTFALPRSYFDKGVRRYGFHGLSYEFVSGRLAEIRPDLAHGRVVICHLGNGASACAVRNGASIASTMGFSALDGLPMGTRCGQLDPGVVLYLIEQEGMSAAQISDLLYRGSGLLGISGVSNDMRELEASSLPDAKAAIDYFVFRVRREIGGLAAAMGGIDALVFCGGIGENSSYVRARVCEDMQWIGIEINADRNAANDLVISDASSRVTVMVVPTNEELVIARAAFALLDRQARIAA